jgi:hypothetical protein
MKSKMKVRLFAKDRFLPLLPMTAEYKRKATVFAVAFLIFL